jgi:hypothetical protein
MSNPGLCGGFGSKAENCLPVAKTPRDCHVKARLLEFTGHRVILTVSHRMHFRCATQAIGLQSTPTSQKVGTVLAALPPPMELEFLGLLSAVLRIATTVAAAISALVLL